MNKVLSKKIIGTSLLAVLASITLIVGTGNARALFVFRGDTLNATGTVSSVDGASFDLETSASDDPLTIVVNRGTRFSGSYNNLRDMQEGDFVTIRADREEGDFVADRVRKSTPDAYGGVGGDETDRFVLRTSVYAGPSGSDSFTAIKDGVPVQVHFDDQTNFRRGTAENLLPGAEIRITGVDRLQDEMLYAERIVFVNNVGLERCESYGTNAIVIFNQSPLIADEEAGASLPPIAANIPAGSYKIIGVSYDNHTGGDTDNAQKEQWKFEGLNGETSVYTSGITKDLPTNRDFNASVLGDSVALPALTEIELKHAAFPDAKPQSIYPVCVVFKPINVHATEDERRTQNRPERNDSLDQALPEE